MSGNGNDEWNLLEKMMRELRDREEPITLVLRPLSALHLAGLIQLAMRHPGTGAQRSHVDVATMFLAHVRTYFAECPATLEVLRMGDDPRYDFERSER